MKVVIKHPGKPAEVTDIDYCGGNGLSYLLGGTPTSCLKYKHLTAWCDDDSISKELSENFARPTDGWVLRGPVVFTDIGYTEEGPDWCGLMSEDVVDVLELFAAIGKE